MNHPASARSARTVPAAVMLAALAVASRGVGSPAAAPPPPPAAPAAPAKAPPATAGKVDKQGFALDANGFRTSEKRGLFRLPFVGGVGLTANGREIELMGLEADKWGPDQIIVLEVDSPGGALPEIMRISQAINKVRERHRMVAWVRKALSAGSVTAMHCDEIYFRTVGTLGACMVINSEGSADPGVVELFKRDVVPNIVRNGRPRCVFDAMVKADAVLTYTKDPVTGAVTWHDRITGLPGERVLSNEHENLTFTAGDALDSKFSKGTVDTEDELAKALGLAEWHELSEYGEKLSAKLVKDFEDCKNDRQRLDAEAAMPRSSEIEQVKVGIARVDKLLSWAKRCPTCFTEGQQEIADVVDRLGREKSELQKRLKDLQKAARGN